MVTRKKQKTAGTFEFFSSRPFKFYEVVSENVKDINDVIKFCGLTILVIILIIIARTHLQESLVKKALLRITHSQLQCCYQRMLLIQLLNLYVPLQRLWCNKICYRLQISFEQSIYFLSYDNRLNYTNRVGQENVFDPFI